MDRGGKHKGRVKRKDGRGRRKQQRNTFDLVMNVMLVARIMAIDSKGSLMKLILQLYLTFFKGGEDQTHAPKSC